MSFSDAVTEPTHDAPRLLSIKQTCRILGIGRTRVYALLAEGRLASVTIGRRRLIPLRAIEALLAALERDR
jgi:excisionase family DNA binding protein